MVFISQNIRLTIKVVIAEVENLGGRGGKLNLGRLY